LYQAICGATASRFKNWKISRLFISIYGTATKIKLNRSQMADAQRLKGATVFVAVLLSNNRLIQQYQGLEGATKA